MKRALDVTIMCDSCVRRHTPDCEDCLVSFVYGGPPEALEISGREADVIGLFTREGLLPELRYRPVGS